MSYSLTLPCQDQSLPCPRPWWGQGRRRESSNKGYCFPIYPCPPTCHCPACSGQSRETSGIAFIISISNNNKIVPFVLLDPRLWRGLYVFKVLLPFVPLDSRHPSRPAFGVDDWGAENDGGRGHHCPACSGQSRRTSGIAFIIGTSNNGTAPFVLLDSRHPSRPAFGVDDWGVGNDGGRGHHCPACSGQSRRTSGIAFIIGTSNNGTAPFVLLDSRHPWRGAENDGGRAIPAFGIDPAWRLGRRE